MTKAFSKLELEGNWFNLIKKKKNPQFPEIAIKRHLPFLDSLLCEARFSSYASAKVFCSIFNAEAGMRKNPTVLYLAGYLKEFRKM